MKVMETIAEFFDWIVFIVLLGLGYSFGTIAEKRHYNSINKREKEHLSYPAVTFSEKVPIENIAKAELVRESVCVSIDYFKRIVAAMINIFGGRVTSYETIVDRGRREAILRLKENAPGADEIIKLRIETSSIGKSANQKGTVGCIEVLAYGTAVWYK